MFFTPNYDFILTVITVIRYYEHIIKAGEEKLE